MTRIKMPAVVCLWWHSGSPCWPLPSESFVAKNHCHSSGDSVPEDILEVFKDLAVVLVN